LPIFILKEDDWVWIADSCLKQALSIRCRIWHDNLEARNMAVPSSIALRVLSTNACRCARWATEYDWSTHLTARHIKGLSSRVDDLVDCLHREVECHKFNDWAKTSH